MCVIRRSRIRAYKVDVKSKFVGRPDRATLESALAGSTRGFVEAIRHGNRIEEPDPEGLIRAGDVLAVAASREAVLRVQPELGPEADDRELLDFPAEIVDVVLTNKALDGKTIKQIAEQFGAEGRGVFLRRLSQGQEMPFNVGTTVNRGDVMQVAGAKRDVERAIKGLGYADRPTEKTDVVFMGLGIVAGALVGALASASGGVPLSLSTSGGALIAGLVCGYLRAVRPTFGRIPEPALWVFNNLGLTIFIAVVGISTGPGFVKGLKESGLSLLLLGVFVTLVPSSSGSSPASTSSSSTPASCSAPARARARRRRRSARSRRRRRARSPPSATPSPTQWATRSSSCGAS